MELLIRNEQKKLRLNLKQLQRIVTSVLRQKGVRDAELSVIFVSRQKIQALNRRYLDRTYATDVLAFDLAEKESSRQKLIGDIFISTDAAVSYARKNSLPLNREITLYVIHGILHLLGFDDHSPSDIARMRGEEQKLLEKVSPYIRGVL